jgi:hypothetical protein
VPGQDPAGGTEKQQGTVDAVTEDVQLGFEGVGDLPVLGQFQDDSRGKTLLFEIHLLVVSEPVAHAGTGHDEFSFGWVQLPGKMAARYRPPVMRGCSGAARSPEQGTHDFAASGMRPGVPAGGERADNEKAAPGLSVVSGSAGDRFAAAGVADYDQDSAQAGQHGEPDRRIKVLALVGFHRIRHQLAHNLAGISGQLAQSPLAENDASVQAG